jgi:hypothetical protein
MSKLKVTSFSDIESNLSSKSPSDSPINFTDKVYHFCKFFFNKFISKHLSRHSPFYRFIARTTNLPDLYILEIGADVKRRMKQYKRVPKSSEPIAFTLASKLTERREERPNE